jgi:hypothetical protein
MELQNTEKNGVKQYSKNKTAHNSVYNQLLGIKSQALSPWIALVYL